MPSAALRHCAEPGCSARVPSGRCTEHRRDARAQTAITYSESWWRRFRLDYIGLLVHAGIAPVCGARLHDGPQPTVSRCHTEGLLTFKNPDGSSLHLHHEPPLTEREARDIETVCNPRRIVLACRACHSAETAGGI